MAAMLATPADLASHLQRDLDEFDARTAEQALETATGRIQQATGQLIVQGTDTVALPGGFRSIWLPQRPVTAITAVTTTLYAVTTTRTEGTDFAVWGSELRWLPRYGVWPERVDVTYTHGYPANLIPQVFRGACLRIAAAVMSNPQGLRSETVGAVSWTAAGASVAEQIQAELAALPRDPVLA